MGRSQVPYFAWAADASSPVHVVTLVAWDRRQDVLDKLHRDGVMPADALIVDHPKFPPGPDYQWRIRDGQIMADPTVPAPLPPPPTLEERIAALEARVR